MFGFQYSLGQRLDGVAIHHRNLLLQNDRPVIELFVDIMDGAAGYLDTGVKRLFLSVKPRKRRQQTRMNIDDPLRKCPDKLRRKQPHIARETDQFHASVFKFGNDLSVTISVIISSGFIIVARSARTTPVVISRRITVSDSDAAAAHSCNIHSIDFR